MLKQYKSSCWAPGWRELSHFRLSLQRMCDTVNFLSQKMLIQIEDCGSNYTRIPSVKKKKEKKEIIMCKCIVRWRNSSFCYGFCSLIMWRFPSVARLKEKVWLNLPQTETVFKGLKHAVDGRDKGSRMNSNDSCSVCFNNCVFYR